MIFDKYIHYDTQIQTNETNKNMVNMQLHCTYTYSKQQLQNKQSFKASKSCI